MLVQGGGVWLGTSHVRQRECNVRIFGVPRVELDWGWWGAADREVSLGRNQAVWTQSSNGRLGHSAISCYIKIRWLLGAADARKHLDISHGCAIGIETCGCWVKEASAEAVYLWCIITSKFYLALSARGDGDIALAGSCIMLFLLQVNAGRRDKFCMEDLDVYCVEVSDTVMGTGDWRYWGSVDIWVFSLREVSPSASVYYISLAPRLYHRLDLLIPLVPEEPRNVTMPAATDFVPETMYPEYIPQIHQVICLSYDLEEEPEEDDEDPEEDPADYPADRDGDDDDDEDEDEDEDEEEYPAPANSIPHVHRMTARISIWDEPSISLPPREEVERLFALTTPPTHHTFSNLHLLYPQIPFPPLPAYHLDSSYSPLGFSLLLL
ncbi:hypothetical protein Tco_1546091 [Tanacetum coccineum]